MPHARDSDPWDVQALRHYQGSTVVHVGEMSETAHTTTTSTLFKKLLTAAFVEVARVELPSWPHGSDALTIWRRATGATAA